MTDTEPTLNHTRQAAEQARAANHAAYNAPGDIANLYDRCGALHELLSCAEQLVRVLGEHIDRARQRRNLYSTDATSPDEHLNAAAGLLRHIAAVHVLDAAAQVNEAWSHLSPIGTRLPDEEV